MQTGLPLMVLLWPTPTNNTKRLQEKTTGGASNTVNEVAQEEY